MSNYQKLMTCLFVLIAQASALALDDSVENLRETSKAFASIGKQVSPSVVFIQVDGQVGESGIAPFSSPFEDDFFDRFFGEPFFGEPAHNVPRQQPAPRRRAVNQGSGFMYAVDDGLLSARTLILTNNHVVEGAESLRVTVSDGREFDAGIVGADPHSDVAVIAINTSNVPGLSLGDSSLLEVSEWVVTIGNPFGLSHSLTE